MMFLINYGQRTVARTCHEVKKIVELSPTKRSYRSCRRFFRTRIATSRCSEESTHTKHRRKCVNALVMLTWNDIVCATRGGYCALQTGAHHRSTRGFLAQLNREPRRAKGNKMKAAATCASFRPVLFSLNLVVRLQSIPLVSVQRRPSYFILTFGSSTTLKSLKRLTWRRVGRRVCVGSIVQLHLRLERLGRCLRVNVLRERLQQRDDIYFRNGIVHRKWITWGRSTGEGTSTKLRDAGVSEETKPSCSSERGFVRFAAFASRTGKVFRYALCGKKTLLYV